MYYQTQQYLFLKVDCQINVICTYRVYVIQAYIATSGLSSTEATTGAKIRHICIFQFPVSPNLHLCLS